MKICIYFKAGVPEDIAINAKFWSGLLLEDIAASAKSQGWLLPEDIAANAKTWGGLLLEDIVAKIPGRSVTTRQH